MKILVVLISLVSLSGFAKDDSSKTLTKKLAHQYFGIATTLAEARQNGDVCELDAYQSEVIRNLQRAIGYDHSLEKSLAKSTLLKSVLKDSAYLREALGVFNPQTGEGLEWTMSQLVFYARNGGAMGPTTIIDFDVNHQVNVKKLDIDTLKWTTYPGTWDVAFDKKTRQITVKIESSVLTDKEFFFEKQNYDSANWILRPTNNAPDDVLKGVFQNEPDECDA